MRRWMNTLYSHRVPPVVQVASHFDFDFFFYFFASRMLVSLYILLLLERARKLHRNARARERESRRDIFQQQQQQHSLMFYYYLFWVRSFGRSVGKNNRVGARERARELGRCFSSAYCWWSSHSRQAKKKENNTRQDITNGSRWIC